MPRYLVEVSQAETVAAKRIDQSIRSIGSHFATHAYWHQKDGLRVGTMVVDVENRRAALGIVPPAMRAAASVYQLEPLSVGGSSAAPSTFALAA